MIHEGQRSYIHRATMRRRIEDTRQSGDDFAAETWVAAFHAALSICDGVVGRCSSGLSLESEGLPAAESEKALSRDGSVEFSGVAGLVASRVQFTVSF